MARDLHALGEQLVRLDGRGYKAYRDIKGHYDLMEPSGRLVVDHVQGDPFADPSRVRVLLPASAAELPEWCYRTRGRRVATADYLNRALYQALQKRRGAEGSGRSGEFRILKPGQEVLERTSLLVAPDGAVEARFGVGLPARGRRVLGRGAAELLCRRVPEAVAASLRFPALDQEALRRHVEVVEDAQALRAQLEDAGLVAFVADGAVLPRRSGADDRPLHSREAVAFASPESLQVTLTAPNGGPLSGLGIPKGVTLIVGGGFHGKSTLLRAIERGVYDHIPGDGRERVVTVHTAVKVRAEDGRSIAGTDISNFISRLPGGTDTTSFQTATASGSTSQAAAIVEALEVGADCLLLDEDTSATNFMIRDARMQALIAREHEPIIPYMDRARQLARSGVSTVLVVGGSGDYFDVADVVIAMRHFRPVDLTEEAGQIARQIPSGRSSAAGRLKPFRQRVPLAGSVDASRGRRTVVKSPTDDRVVFGREEIRLSAVEQFVETAQLRAVAQALIRSRGRELDGRNTLPRALGDVMDRIREDGLAGYFPEPRGDLAEFRVFEAAAFLNRIRALQVSPAEPREEPLRRRFIVSGRVQGVFYRSWTQEQGTGLGLGGTVRNLPDGAVEVEAVGPSQAISRLEELLAEGPPAARVDDVREVPPSDAELPSTFEIRY